MSAKYSPLTRPVGPDKINRSVTLTMHADALLGDIAREFGVSVNEFCRQALAHYAAAKQSAKAIAFRAAISRQQMAGAVCLLMTGFVWWQSIHSDGEEFRKGRSQGRVARTVRVRGRDVELLNA